MVEKTSFITVENLAAMWRKETTLKHLGKRVFSLPPQDSDTSVFKSKYDKVQRQLRSIAAMDDLLSGKRLIS